MATFPAVLRFWETAAGCLSVPREFLFRIDVTDHVFFFVFLKKTKQTRARGMTAAVASSMRMTLLAANQCAKRGLGTQSERVKRSPSSPANADDTVAVDAVYIPQKTIQELHNGKEPDRPTNPDEAVASGAAVQEHVYLAGSGHKQTCSAYDGVLAEGTPVVQKMTQGLINRRGRFWSSCASSSPPRKKSSMTRVRLEEVNTDDGKCSADGDALADGITAVQ